MSQRGCTNVSEGFRKDSESAEREEITMPKTRQEPLFVECLEEAVEAVAMACGGKKAFACELRPDLREDPEAAHRWLLDALNPDRRTELHAIHIIRACRVAREHGCHILKHWFDDQTGYERTGVAPRKTERQILADEMQRIAARFKELAEAAARLDRDDRMELRAVR